jgi:hypothetical protein
MLTATTSYLNFILIKQPQKLYSLSLLDKKEINVSLKYLLLGNKPEGQLRDYQSYLDVILILVKENTRKKVNLAVLIASVSSVYSRSFILIDSTNWCR